MKILACKKNWSTPGPDHLVWWKRAHALYKGVVSSFQAISEYEEDYSPWFSEGKTSLIPKPIELTSENQRSITYLNTIYTNGSSLDYLS